MSDIESRIGGFFHEEANKVALPPGLYRRVRQRAKVRRMMTGALTGLVATAVGVAGFTTIRALGSTSDIDPAAPGSPDAVASSRMVDGCPVTVPPQPGFVPPEPYPHEPPELYDAVWYGDDGLWTMLAPEGEVWRDLPADDKGLLAQKLTWWSAGYPTDEEPRPHIVLTGRRLDAPGSYEVGGPAGGGFRDDIGSFMLLGLEVPAGCWEWTATFDGAELSYVALVKGPSS